MQLNQHKKNTARLCLTSSLTYNTVWMGVFDAVPYHSRSVYVYVFTPFLLFVCCMLLMCRINES